MRRFSGLTPATLVALASFFAGCEREPASSRVGFSQIGAESAWRTAETESIRSEAENRGIRLYFSDAQGKQENQLQALNTFIAQGVDAIVLAPQVETGWEPILTEVKQADIPVILVDRGIDVPNESLYTTLIASDFVAEGRMAGEWLVDALDGEGNVVELQGTAGAAPALDRKQGFAEAIADTPGVKIIKSQDADFSRARGKEVMEAFLKSGGEEIHAVYAHNDDMALGAIQAIEEAGLDPGDDILIVSIDGIRDAFQAMIDGDLNATVECNPLLGPLVFDAIDKILAGETVPKWIKVEDRLFTRDLAADAIDERLY